MNYHPVTKQIVDILESRGFWFETFEHEPVRTSEEAAAIRPEYKLSQGAKAMIIKAKKEGEKSFMMIVVPGDKKFDSAKLREAGIKDVRFAKGDEVEEITGGVLPGGVPPFGNIFGLPVYADKSIFDNEKIIYNAGDRSFSVGMYSKDWKKLVDPFVVNIV